MRQMKISKGICIFVTLIKVILEIQLYFKLKMKMKSMQRKIEKQTNAAFQKKKLK